MNILIAAIGEDLSLGSNGKLLWHIPEDLAHFKELTTGKTVVMGRKTWESLPKKPLPNRRNIVITRDKNYKIQGGEIYHSLLEILKEGNICIIGGGEIYDQSLKTNLIDKIYLTRIYRSFPEADTFFPELDTNLWKIEDKQELDGFCFETWTKE